MASPCDPDLEKILETIRGAFNVPMAQITAYINRCVVEGKGVDYIRHVQAQGRDAARLADRTFDQVVGSSAKVASSNSKRAIPLVDQHRGIDTVLYIPGELSQSHPHARAQEGVDYREVHHMEDTVEVDGVAFVNVVGQVKIYAINPAIMRKGHAYCHDPDSEEFEARREEHWLMDDTISYQQFYAMVSNGGTKEPLLQTLPQEFQQFESNSGQTSAGAYYFTPVKVKAPAAIREATKAYNAHFFKEESRKAKKMSGDTIPKGASDHVVMQVLAKASSQSWLDLIREKYQMDTPSGTAWLRRVRQAMVASSPCDISQARQDLSTHTDVGKMVSMNGAKDPDQVYHALLHALVVSSPNFFRYGEDFIQFLLQGN